MKKPLIGILGNLLLVENGVFAGMERSYVNNDYIESVKNAGGVPIIIPPLECIDVIKAQINILDGVIISGGYDINPLFYGDEPREKLGHVHPLVDEFTVKAIKVAVQLGKPILGICKGIQILNVAFGGTLYQDISYMPGAFVKHSQNVERHAATHSIEVEKGSKLYQITQGDIQVNSFHHEVLKDVAQGFKVTARAKDGVVEAIEKEGEIFVMGVQWHPEMMAATNEKMMKLFERFIDEAGGKL
ncbi:gamma-glutamyl-gamma-aminobutyrate hydrolase [Clostridium polyendosporum]|uniref:Gamma-glutamyl-gamma-aminobutyrate hydrolase n=1 Tax=Clostridium polyendosporum TaxID=69208 RepID=A0A919VES3_9CLOT|nr:gamma-glutamyl-gamma-aminobutyrate hydrolase family protein [Clostridium polyendosporum]GIM27407.1 gamma-glutamyl-gamma-aminobutyrate hydrolase [Clostridium polyendosporum]